MILTDEEMKELHSSTFGKGLQTFARAIEAAVLEKLRQQEPSSDLDVLRRIAERGLNHYQAKFDNVGVDLFQHMLDEIKRCAAPVPAAVPDGWSIKRDGDAFIVQKDGVGGYVARENEDNIASEILYRLADSMLSVAPAMQETANTNSERISSKLVNGAKGGE